MKGENMGPNLSKLGAAIALVALVFGVAFGSGGPNVVSAAPATVVVGQTNGGGATGVNQFNAAAVTITAGETVTWNSALDNRSHDVSAYAEAVAGTPDWQSPTLRSGTANTTFSRAFSPAGTYTYYCSLHANRADAAPGVIDANIASGQMVGKITVDAPAPDLTAPTVSLVSASPNPTDGAGSVTLTATVTDSGTPLGTIASARYRIDGGASVAMAAADGTFNASSEGVSASVPVGALALGPHTLDVQGTDNAGNNSAFVGFTLTVSAPPAGAVQATITVNAGNLTNTAQNVAFPAVALDGADQIKDGTTTPAWLAKDARGSGAGWNVTISSGNFTSATGSIGVANFKCRLLQSNIVTVSGNTAPTTAVGTLVPLSGTPTRLLAAALNAGMGQYSYTPDFQLTVPGSTAAGAYTANVSVSINSGP